MSLALLVSLLVALILLLVVYWAIHKLAAVFGAPPQLVVIVDVLLVLLFVVYALQVLGLLSWRP